MYHNSGDLSRRANYDFDQIKSIGKVTVRSLLLLYIFGSKKMTDRSSSWAWIGGTSLLLCWRWEGSSSKGNRSTVCDQFQ